MKRPFVQVPLSSIVEDGVLYTANKQFFWPLGLALTVVYDTDKNEYTDLQIRQWDPPEVITGVEDEIEKERAERFAAWDRERRSTLIP